MLFALLRDTRARRNGILRKTRYLSTLLLNRDIKWIIVAGHYIMKYQVVRAVYASKFHIIIDNHAMERSRVTQIKWEIELR